jgi:hypothetical protein
MLPSGLPEVVADDEDVARVLTSASHFNRIGAKPAAFMPRSDTNETSVFRHGSEPRPGLWAIADELVGSDRNVHGIAVVEARYVRAADLDVVADEPPPRHANIVGWPSSDVDPDMTKAERKERALLIASRSELITR